MAIPKVWLSHDAATYIEDGGFQVFDRDGTEITGRLLLKSIGYQFSADARVTDVDQ